MNVYEASPPNENTVDFAALLGESSTDGNKEREDSGQDRADIEILHLNVTFVLFPHICRPASLPTSTFYTVKILEHLPDDDHVAHVRTDWYAQDLVDPILFTTTGEEYTVSKDGIKGTVHVTLIADDTVEITKNDHYNCLASLHTSETMFSLLKNRKLTLRMIWMKDSMKTTDPKEAKE